LEIKSGQEIRKHAEEKAKLRQRVRSNVGGPGSGRWPSWVDGSKSKETTEDYFALDIRKAKRHGLIETGQEEVLGIAPIEWISAGFGAGEGYYLRPWFRCPGRSQEKCGEKCGRRVAILYGRMEEGELDEDSTWACRKCLNLCYKVELEDPAERLQRKSSKLRAKLGDGHTKPKRMHNKTFVRLGIEYLKIQRELSEAMHERTMGMLETMEKEKIAYDL